MVYQLDEPDAGTVLWHNVLILATDMLAVNIPTKPENPVVVEHSNKRFTPFVSVVRPITSVACLNSDDIGHPVDSASKSNRSGMKLYGASDVRLEPLLKKRSRDVQ